MELQHPARLTRDPLVTLGGAFMVSPQLAAEEARLGLPDHSLYFRGRSAALGDPPPAAADTPGVAVSTAIEAHSRGCAAWGSDELGAVVPAEETADLLDDLLPTVR